MNRTRKVLLSILVFTATASFSNAAQPKTVLHEGSAPMCMPLDPVCDLFPPSK